MEKVIALLAALNISQALDQQRLRCLICDVMRKPDEFFCHSTMRELCERWQCFAEVKGYAENGDV
ncbi:MAG: hypothetical protein MR291_03385 [Oscillospiraceae bacterium]|nr:hypothetical protein [Oscillospiraceae bacterium]